MSNFPDSPNPYGSPTHGHYGPQYGYGPQGLASRLPIFCIVMFAIDLVFCFIRMLLVGAGIVGLLAAGGDPMVVETGLLEVATGAGMVLFGIPADIAMLVKQKWALVLAWVKVVATLGSVGVGLWQMSFILDQLPPGSAERIGGMIVGGIVTVIRLGLLALYVTALVMFAKWTGQRPAPNPYSTQRY